MYHLLLLEYLMPAVIPKTIRDRPVIVRAKPKAAPASGSVWYGMNMNHSGFSARLKDSSMPPTKNMAPAKNIK